MKKTAKIILALFLLVMVIVAGLSLFVRFYLTDERLKEMLIPPAEEALARKVSLGDIDVGIFRGITLNDLVIKEADGQTDFVRAKAFVLSYELFPLLRKKLVIGEIRFLEPNLRLVRDANGTFNFETLPFLVKKAPPPSEKSAGNGAAALPFALTIDQIRVENARLSLVDATRELPDVDLQADLALTVDLSPDLANLHYQGNLSFEAVLVHGKLKPTIRGKSNFDSRNLEITADVTLDQEQVHLDGKVENYTQSPNIRLDLSSDALDLDHLLALTAGLPVAAGQAARKAPEKDAPAGRAIPQDLRAEGKVQVAKAIYNNFTVENFLLHYTLGKGLFTITDLTAQAADGTIQADRIEVDLNRPELGYSGSLKIKGMQIAPIVRAVAPKTPDVIGGKLEASLNFEGSGTSWQDIQQTLTADSTFALQESWLRHTELTRTVASLVGLQELNDLSFTAAAGSLRLEKGDVLLNSKFTGEQLGLEAQGIIGLDGRLNLPVTMKLSPLLSEKLRQRIAVAKYLAEEGGETVLKLKITGTVKQPRPVLDQAAVREQTEKAIKNKLFEELDKAIQKKEGDSQKLDPARELLKGLFGK
jgi:uncharacterized protein involved in outer membrane biogenesis